MQRSTTQLDLFGPQAPTATRPVPAIPPSRPSPAPPPASLPPPRGRAHLRQLVYDAHASAWASGLTDDQLAQRYPGKHPGSLGKRRQELVEDGVLVDSGKSRPTRFGKMATVWVLRSDPGPRS